MPKATIINKFGRMQGWNALTVEIMGREVEGFTEIEYDDSVSKENAYGGGKYPVGRGEGNYEAKCAITLYKEEMDAIQKSLPPGSRFQDIPPFDITCEYEQGGGVLSKDRIRNFEFKNRGIPVKQGDGTIAFKFEGLVSHIEWGV